MLDLTAQILQGKYFFNTPIYDSNSQEENNILSVIQIPQIKNQSIEVDQTPITELLELDDNLSYILRVIKKLNLLIVFTNIDFVTINEEKCFNKVLNKILQSNKNVKILMTSH